MALGDLPLKRLILFLTSVLSAWRGGLVPEVPDELQVPSVLIIFLTSFDPIPIVFLAHSSSVVVRI